MFGFCRFRSLMPASSFRKKYVYFPNGFWENYRFYREMFDLFLILDFPDNDNLDIGRVVFYGQT